MKEFVFNAHTVTFLVSGPGITVFLNRIYKGGVRLCSVKFAKKGVYLRLPYQDLKKLFAICKNMCYNIIWDRSKEGEESRRGRVTLVKIREGGFLFPIKKLLKNLGAVLGLVAFIAGIYLLDGTLLGYELDVPIELKAQVLEILEQNGATVGTRFSRIDTEELGKIIVRQCGGIEFASVHKEGCFLVLDAVEREKPFEMTKKEDFLSPVNGEILSITVLRGTPLVNVGDRVEVGTPLVGAYFLAEEQRFPAMPVYKIEVKGEYLLEVKIGGDSEYELAAVVALAKEKCPFSQIIGVETQVEEEKDGKKITVKLQYKESFGG